MTIGIDDISIHISDPGELWEEFYSLNKAAFEDLLCRFSQAREEEDFIWLTPYEDRFFLFGLLWEEQKRFGAGMLYIIKNDPDFNESYWYNYDDSLSPGDSRALHAKELYDYLKSPDGLGIPEEFPFFKEHNSDQKEYKVLVIKMPQQHQLLLPVSFDAFSEGRFGGFSRYTATRFIISDKSFMTDFEERKEIEQNLKNDELFISKTVFMINSYEHFFEDAGTADLCTRAVEYIKELKDCFDPINFNGRDRRLRFRFDEPASTLIEDFGNEDTWYIYANFHTVNFRWVLEKEQHDDFHERLMALDIGHIKKMKIFHCYSRKVYNGRASIVTQLIEKGVQQVEGSNGKENYTDFLYMVIYTLIYDRRLFVKQYEWKSGKSLLGRGEFLLQQLLQPDDQNRQSKIRI